MIARGECEFGVLEPRRSIRAAWGATCKDSRLLLLKAADPRGGAHERSGLTYVGGVMAKWCDNMPRADFSFLIASAVFHKCLGCRQFCGLLVLFFEIQV